MIEVSKPAAAETELVLTRREGPVAWLTLNRTEAANSIDAPMAAAFRSAVAALSNDHEVRALVLDGAGKMFCAGGDLASFAHQGADAPGYVRGLIHDLHAGLQLMARFHAPVIAAVHGAAAGAGLGLALNADLVVATESSRFVMAYTRAGLTPDGGTSWALPRLVGVRRALELTLMNRTLSAEEALSFGLITEVVADDALAARVTELAHEIAAGPTAAYATARRLLREGLQRDYASHLDAEAASIVRSFATTDGQEGVRAFHERRAPKFHGR